MKWERASEAKIEMELLDEDDFGHACWESKKTYILENKYGDLFVGKAAIGYNEKKIHFEDQYGGLIDEVVFIAEIEERKRSNKWQ